jgi:hypothetical protein
VEESGAEKFEISNQEKVTFNTEFRKETMFAVNCAVIFPQIKVKFTTGSEPICLF